MNEVNQTYTDYKKIILLRDPRGITNSYFNAWFDLNEKSLYKILCVANDNLYSVKYENLTEYPEKQIKKINIFLSLEDSELNKDIEQEKVLTENPVGTHENLTKPVFKNSGKYKNSQLKYRNLLRVCYMRK